MPYDKSGKNTPTIFEQLMGKRRTDIQLPADVSQRDSRLKGKSVREVMQKVPASLEQLRKLGKR